ncbi:eukaryotic translation initiation factor 3 subunit 3 [Nadsonia fulvescens var. elongata DSM 6958]|uniref:Eukaryotic translation initiation factor 3 subunit H n=1 Tax=Nadsonia fulvescens var. elongata DSM 6958 TaxID=857566 RepID=A0A1E3PLA8_9ASCO|nr:eukaryotic translation initiation factor 3 subunit 3 [Nadsonia fulvescens var. elongata DSM 6958]
MDAKPLATKVVVDSSVVLHIVKHASEAAPYQACGQLLGLDNQDILEVTHGFNLPVSNSFYDSNDSATLRTKAINKYIGDMVEQLKEVKVDANTVGFYQCTHLGKFINHVVIDNLYAYQKENPEAVVLVYDLSKTVYASFSFKAYRLSPAFIAVKKSGKFSTKNLVEKELSYHDILEEVPVEIHNSHLVTLLLQNLSTQQPESSFTLNSTFNSLDITIDPYLEKTMESIFDSIDDFHYDQGNYNYYQRQLAREQSKISQWQQKRKAENHVRQQKGEAPLPLDNYGKLFKLPEEPSRLENLLISAQLDKYCTQIEEFGATVSSKLFATQKSLEA